MGPIFSSPPSTTHSPRGILRNPKASRTKTISIEGFLKATVTPHFFYVELVFQKNVFLETRLGWNFAEVCYFFAFVTRLNENLLICSWWFFDYSNEHLVTVLCFNVVISNLRDSEELGLFTYTVLFSYKKQRGVKEGPGLGSQTVQVCIPALHLISIVTLSKYLTSLYLSFFFYKLGIIIILINS